MPSTPRVVRRQDMTHDQRRLVDDMQRAARRAAEKADEATPSAA